MNDDLHSIIGELKEINKKLSNSYKELWLQSKAFSIAERDYKISLQKKILELKTSGMAVTLIPDLARGSEEVAELKFKRDLAERLWDSAREANRSLRTMATVYQSILRVQDEV